MARTNKPATMPVVEERLAGGMGPHAALQSDEGQLRRATMACLLWEDVHYESGQKVVDGIGALIPKVAPEKVAEVAVEARLKQKLRHVPLLIAREMCRYETHKPFVRDVLAQVVMRPDELTEFVSLYEKTGGKQGSIPKQAKLGLADAFGRFDEYQLAKYNRKTEIKLRDVLRMVHPVPKDEAQSALWKRLSKDELATPDTWEVGMTNAHTPEEKRAVWERLIDARKLPVKAMLQNLDNLVKVGVPREKIVTAMRTAKTGFLLPLDFFKAAQHAKDFNRELEDMMFRCLGEWPKLPGHTIFVCDVSGSMSCAIASRSIFNRMQAAAAMAVLAAEVCESLTVYVTAGSDSRAVHKTLKLPTYRGFGLADKIVDSASYMGGGGIFTRQALEFIKKETKEKPERIAVFSDSQDCDQTDKKPAPFGKFNYVIDVSSHTHGINYQNVWTAEIAGWSENFLRYIAALEGVAAPQTADDEQQ